MYRYSDTNDHAKYYCAASCNYNANNNCVDLHDYCDHINCYRRWNIFMVQRNNSCWNQCYVVSDDSRNLHRDRNRNKWMYGDSSTNHHSKYYPANSRNKYAIYNNSYVYNYQYSINSYRWRHVFLV